MKPLAIIFLSVAIAFLSLSASAQNYIGLHKDEIAKRMPQENKGFYFEKEVNVDDRGFLKYVNTLDEQTILFMIDTDGFCTAVSRMYNTWLYDQVVNELNSKYQQVSTNKWLEIKEGKSYDLTLIKGKWFLTLTIRPHSK
ncbi:hypothetical protein [Tenuifilum sp.]|jgi:hypothetical protein|uniref:hypothetical protein n=1 Tax=Tenuifilum sp. TaxID=2760880 RepID=UPI001B69DC23|nr:hypothetical protein [Bacteroidales bacterium]HON71669.1 hypothetical protein [Tenuifilum sp.]HOU74246.1 hypothetical protein [Tenuifilum sp.]HQE54568.1 hypothetical protein [Tenuifilum sp.]HQG71759.1 hypothetical protein [Tenuifilum sp.]